jgi:hypothetical protein
MRRSLATTVWLLILLAASPAWAADALNIGVGLPVFADAEGAAPGTTNFELNGTTDQLEVITQARVAGSLTQGCVRYGLRTGTPPTYRISIQGVDASGNPDGTIKGGGSPVSTTFTPPADTTWDATFRCFTFTNAYTTTRGEFIALVVDYSAGTADGTNNSSFTSIVSNLYGRTGTAPYAIQNDAGARTRPAATQKGIAPHGLVIGGTMYGLPYQGQAQTTFSSDSTPDEYALAFTIPSGWCSTAKVAGFRFDADGPAAAGTTVFALYTGTTVLQTITVDTDTWTATTNSRLATVYFTEATLSTLTCGTQYRIGIAPQDALQSIGLRVITMANATDNAAWPAGSGFYLSTRTDAGAWSDTTTSRPIAEIILNDLTPPSGSTCICGAVN